MSSTRICAPHDILKVMFSEKQPKNDGKYYWTNHVKDKMRYYRISESLVKRVVRFPKRIEEGIARGTTAVMQPRVVNGKTKEEIWVMYIENQNSNIKMQNLMPGKRKIITAWRYPGASPVRAQIPIPADILAELENEIGE